MTRNRKAFYSIAYITPAILLCVCLAFIDLLKNEQRAAVSSYMVASLDTTVELIDRWANELIKEAKANTERQDVIELVDFIGNSSGEDQQKAVAVLQELYAPLFKSGKYEAISIIKSDGTFILSAVKSLIGTRIKVQAAKDVVDKAFNEGAAISPPLVSPSPVMRNGVYTDNLIYQSVCSRVDKENKPIAILCLRFDPEINFYPILKLGRTRQTGEIYAIDRIARLNSPSRFVGKTDLKGLSISSDAPLYGVYARKPIKKASLPNYQYDPSAPLTALAAKLIVYGKTGFMDQYTDYRDVPVVGAGKWMNSIDMGIIYEVDEVEAYAEYKFSRNVIILFSISVLFLIWGLNWYSYRSRLALANREAQLRAMIDYLPASAYLKDIDGSYLIANYHLANSINVPLEEIIGKSDWELRTQRDAKSNLEITQEVIKNKAAKQYFYQKKDTRSGQEKHFSAIEFPIIDMTSKSLVAVGGISFDITDQVEIAKSLENLTHSLEEKVKQRTVQLEEAKLAAEQATQAKSAFLANVSHEIRTPLNAVIGLSDVALRLNDVTRTTKYLERIQQAGRTLLGIINDILDFSKIEAGKFIIEEAEFSVEQMLDRVASLVWAKVDAKGIELVLDAERGVPLRLIGDELRISQILINLAENAVKFTDQGTVTIRARCAENPLDQINTSCINLILEVEDTGIGIEPAVLTELFHPFTQADSSTTKRFEGTGLGLAISKRLAELMGGKIIVDSVPGKGSLFSLKIPLKKSIQPVATVESQVSLLGKFALIVEDNEQSRQVIVSMLRSYFCEVSECDNWLDAVANIETAMTTECPFDLIVLDSGIPGFSDKSAIKKIRAMVDAAQHTKLILISQRDAHTAEFSALFDGEIQKPVTASAVLKMTMQVLGKVDEQKYFQTPVNIEDISPQISAEWRDALAGKAVLVAEDNEGNQEVIEALLNLIGIKPDFANNGYQALALLEKNHYDLVLMDMYMPEMDGYETSTRIRAKPEFNSLPIIAVTASAMRNEKEACIALKMNAYVSKPIVTENLFSAMMDCLKDRKEKAKLCAEPASETVEKTSKDTAIPAGLYAIPDLNVELGLSYLMGNMQLYLNMIKRLATERTDTVELVRNALLNGDIESAIDLVHNLSSLSAWVGAEKLNAMARTIELRLRERRELNSLIEDLDNHYQTLLRHLADVVFLHPPN